MTKDLISPKCRAWDTKRKKMIYGPTDDNVSASWVFSLYESLKTLDPGRLVLMWGTGVLDKNGKEVFELDILKVCFERIICYARVEYGSYSDDEYLSDAECFVLKFSQDSFMEGDSWPLSDRGGMHGIGKHTIECMGNHLESEEMLMSLGKE